MPTYKDVLTELESLTDPGAVKNKSARFGIWPEQSLGIYQADLNRIAKRIGYDNELAEQFFASGIYDAKLLCRKLYDPAEVTEAKMGIWVRQFDTWEICDSFCCRVFAHSKYSVPKALEWSAREPELVKRVGFATMAHYVFA